MFSGSKWGCHWRMWIQCMECCAAHLFVEFSILKKSCATRHMQDISSVIGNTQTYNHVIYERLLLSVFLVWLSLKCHKTTTSFLVVKLHISIHDILYENHTCQDMSRYGYGFAFWDIQPKHTVQCKQSTLTIYY